MSLLSHLRDSHSPVRNFLCTEFPLTRAFAKKTNPAFAEVPTIRPAHKNGHPFGTIGIAFDYRLRYYYRITPCRRLVAYRGALALILYGAIHPHLARDFFANLTTFLRKLRPVGNKLSRRDEEQLARYCIVLALFEEIFRAGPYIILSESSPLFTISPSITKVDGLLRLARPGWVSDLVSLGATFHANCASLGCKKATLNPTFDGSLTLAALTLT